MSILALSLQIDDFEETRHNDAIETGETEEEDEYRIVNNPECEVIT